MARRSRTRVWRWQDEYGVEHREYTRAEARRLSRASGTSRTAYSYEYQRRRLIRVRPPERPGPRELPRHAAELFIDDDQVLPKWRSFIRNQRSVLGPMYDWAIYNGNQEVADQAALLIREANAIAATDSPSMKRQFRADTSEIGTDWMTSGTWDEVIGITGTTVYDWLYWTD